MALTFRVVSSGLNVRSAPDATATVLTQLTQGSPLEATGVAAVKLGDGNTWIRVRTADGVEGWVNRKFTDMPFAYRVVAHNLNLRAQPDPDAAILAVLAEGEALEATGVAEVTLPGGSVWINVGTAAVTGWANKRFLGARGGGALGGRLASIWGGGTAPVTQEFGHTPFSTGKGADIYDFGKVYGLDGDEHTGLDIGLADGTPLFAPLSGTVTIAGGSGVYKDETGRHPESTSGEIMIELEDGAQLILGHTSLVTVKKGQRVSPGDSVGLSGTANGAHVHVEVRILDPSLPSGRRIIDPRDYLARF